MSRSIDSTDWTSAVQWARTRIANDTTAGLWQLHAGGLTSARISAIVIRCEQQPKIPVPIVLARAHQSSTQIAPGSKPRALTSRHF